MAVAASCARPEEPAIHKNGEVVMGVDEGVRAIVEKGDAPSGLRIEPYEPEVFLVAALDLGPEPPPGLVPGDPRQVEVVVGAEVDPDGRPARDRQDPETDAGIRAS